MGLLYVRFTRREEGYGRAATVGGVCAHDHACRTTVVKPYTSQSLQGRAVRSTLGFHRTRQGGGKSACSQRNIDRRAVVATSYKFFNLTTYVNENA